MFKLLQENIFICIFCKLFFTASVQGVNFAPRQETLPVYSTSSSIEGTPATVKKMSASIEAVACKVNELNDGE